MSTSGPRILVVDDERQIRRFLRTALTTQGYGVVEVSSGEDALATVPTLRPDLIILDLGLPGRDGIEVTKQIREWSHTPIVILSVRGQDEDKIAALDAGADDYLTKPFSVGELLARIRVAIRHATRPADEPIVTTGELVVDLAHRLVSISEREVALTPIEYDLLKVLVIHAGKVLTHRQLLREVWGPGYDLATHLLRVNMSNLRHKVEPDPARPRYIVTEPGVGYRLRAIDTGNAPINEGRTGLP